MIMAVMAGERNGRRMTITELLLKQPRTMKRVMMLALDAVLCIATTWAAFWGRLEFLPSFGGPVALATCVAIFLALPIFFISGAYNSIFRYASGHTQIVIVRAVSLYGVAFAMVFAVMGIPGVPRSIGITQPLLLLLSVVVVRSFVSFMLSGARGWRRDGGRSNVVIYGAGAAGQQLASAISQGSAMRAVAFVDDNPNLHGGVLNRLRVYNPAKLPELIEEFDVREVLLAFPSAGRRRRISVIESLRGLDVAVRTLPGIMDIAHGRVEVTDIKPLEIEDILGRDSVAPNLLLLQRHVTGKVVLVTGAGGSIGSELCRQIFALGPKVILLVESNEYALYAIHQELTSRDATVTAAVPEVVPLLGSVCNPARMRDVIETWRPHTIYHAAAYKHVPLVEHNPIEGIRNNVFGTMTTALAARGAGVPNFVLVSTDKAVRPTNVMGASKRLAEIVLQALAAEKGGTCFSMVRFGNVLGSSGSVVPLFRKQIAEGGPITITDPEITRFFMTIPEAAQLVVQAGAMARGGEVFVLDMGQPVRIVDLARRMVELSGLTLRSPDEPNGDIEIKVVGLRPGEKLYEELLIGNDPQATSHPLIMKAHEHFIPWSDLSRELDDLWSALDEADVVRARALLVSLVPEYSPAEHIVDFVSVERGDRLAAPAQKIAEAR